MNLEDSPIFKIHKFMFLTEKLIDKELCDQFDVSFSQFRVLHVIHRNPGISQKHIAFIQDTTQAAVSRHIDVLADVGFVALATNSGNRKEHNVHLTVKGKTLLEKMHDYVEKKMKNIHKALGQKGTKDLDDISDVLILTIRKEYGDWQNF